MELLFFLLQILILIIISPFLSGVMRKFKNSIRMRKGASVFQSYYNIGKYLAKEEAISGQASIIFYIAPYIVLASLIVAFLFVPVFHFSCWIQAVGGVVCLFFFLGLARFFLVLAGLDTGSSFGGMGSSRDMFISSLAEPVAICALAVVGLKSGSLNLQSGLNLINTPVSVVVALAALLSVIIAETSRIPVDNQETHLELTMIHEAMLLEYSGRSLAMLELAAHIKQILFFSVAAGILWPFPVTLHDTAQVYLASFPWFMGKVFFIGFVVSILEIMLAKMRLFRAVDFLGFGFLLSVLALVMVRLGV